MNPDLLQRPFTRFGEYDPMSVVWALGGPAADDDEDEGDSYSRGGSDDDDEDEDAFDEDSDDDSDGGDTLWAAEREMRQRP